jgi:hypothetical protein
MFSVLYYAGHDNISQSEGVFHDIMWVYYKDSVAFHKGVVPEALKNRHDYNN